MSHKAINAGPCAFMLSVRPQDYQRGFSFGGFIPFFSAYGAMCGLFAGLCGGMEVKLFPTFSPEEFPALLFKNKPNIFYGVPHFYELLMDSPKLRKKNKKLNFIKIAISGGDKIAPATLERVNTCFERSGCRSGLRVGYGSTELGGSIAVMPYYDPHNTELDWHAEGNVGYVLANCVAKVVNPETMEELPYGEDGELLVHSQSQMQCYLGKPEQTKEVTWLAPDGVIWIRMGDRGHLTSDGTFCFGGRFKRSIMRPDGHTVHPAPIENVILQHDAVLDCAVVGLTARVGETGSIPTAFVVLRHKPETKQETDKLLEEIDKHCLKHLPERDRALAFKAIDDLPMTPMGKIHFRELEKTIYNEAELWASDCK
jgi:long-chain acyl-CoA synthetase